MMSFYLRVSAIDSSMSRDQVTIRLMTISQGVSHTLAKQPEFTIPVRASWSQCLIKIHGSLVTLRFNDENVWSDEGLLEVWDWKLCKSIYVSQSRYPTSFLYEIVYSNDSIRPFQVEGQQLSSVMNALLC
jgi:hypothetical protein